jgi:hypothetical protein
MDEVVRAVAPEAAPGCVQGFDCVSHFNRLFRRRFGCRPCDVRKAARSGGARPRPPGESETP